MVRHVMDCSMFCTWTPRRCRSASEIEGNMCNEKGTFGALGSISSTSKYHPFVESAARFIK